jgi:hypothetical protein
LRTRPDRRRLTVRCGRGAGSRATRQGLTAASRSRGAGRLRRALAVQDGRYGRGERLAQRRHGSQDRTRGEHGAGERDRRPDQCLTPVPGSPRPARPRPVAWRGAVAAANGVQAPDRIRQETLAGGPEGGPAGVGRADPRADPLQAFRARLYVIGGSVQRTTQEIAKVLPLRWRPVMARCHDYSCSRAARRAVMPRAV